MMDSNINWQGQIEFAYYNYYLSKIDKDCLEIA